MQSLAQYLAGHDVMECNQVSGTIVPCRPRHLLLIRLERRLLIGTADAKPGAGSNDLAAIGAGLLA